MTFSLFDWLVISIRPKDRISPDGAFPGLTPEEIREGLRQLEPGRAGVMPACLSGMQAMQPVRGRL